MIRSQCVNIIILLAKKIELYAQTEIIAINLWLITILMCKFQKTDSIGNEPLKT